MDFEIEKGTKAELKYVIKNGKEEVYVRTFNEVDSLIYVGSFSDSVYQQLSKMTYLEAPKARLFFSTAWGESKKFNHFWYDKYDSYGRVIQMGDYNIVKRRLESSLVETSKFQYKRLSDGNYTELVTYYDEILPKGVVYKKKAFLVHYDKHNIENRITEFSYDSVGVMISTITKALTRQTFEWLDSNTFSKTFCYADSSSQLNYCITSIVSKNKKGQIVKEVNKDSRYDKDGYDAEFLRLTNFYELYTYNSEGAVVLKKKYTLDDELVSTRTYEYGIITKDTKSPQELLSLFQAVE